MSNVLLTLFGTVFVAVVITGIYLFLAGPINLPTPPGITDKGEDEMEPEVTTTAPSNTTSTPTATPTTTRATILVGTSSPTTTNETKDTQ